MIDIDKLELYCKYSDLTNNLYIQKYIENYNNNVDLHKYKLFSIYYYPDDNDKSTHMMYVGMQKQNNKLFHIFISVELYHSNLKIDCNDSTNFNLYEELNYILIDNNMINNIYQNANLFNIM